MSISEQIRAKAKELLEQGKVECVIGYEKGSLPDVARPSFVYKADEVDNLIFDSLCSHNLTTYLPGLKGKSVAVVVKACDNRSLNVLLQEHQVERDKVYVIGVVCDGVKVEGKLQARCEACAERVPANSDFLAGEPTAAMAASVDFADVVELEGKSAAERMAYWHSQFDSCIRCFACRQTCPNCYCSECIAEQTMPEWVMLPVDPLNNKMFHIIRAYHMAGRCVGCNECERACPMGIPISLLNRKIAKDVRDLFGHVAGLFPDAEPPLATFRKEETLTKA